MKAKRRQFNRGYAPNPPTGRYSHYHHMMRLPKDAVCAYAHLGGCDGPLEKDHIVPRDAGGESTVENIRPLCRRHNRQRGNEYRQSKNENRK